MMRMLLVTIGLLMALPLWGETLVFETIDGNRESVFGKDGPKVAVLVFIDAECPVANSYQPELRRLEKAYAPQGVRFVMIHADPDIPLEKAKEHAKEFGITGMVVIDKGHTWAKRAGATVTPEAVVIDAEGKTRYLGRIDDRYAELGRKRPEAKVRDLDAALTQLLAGEVVKVPKTEAVGCKILVE